MKNPYTTKKVKIDKILNETSEIKTFVVKTKENYNPGQFYQVGIYGVGEAPISVASDSKSNIHFCIRNVGNVTRALHILKKGGEFTIRGPYGNGYPMKKFHGKDIVLVGGGTGVAPMKGAIDYIKNNRKKFGDVKLFFGFRTTNDILFKYDFKEWEKNCELNITLDKGDKKWKGSVGLVTKLLENANINKSTIAITCGPPIMMKFVALELIKKGIPEKNIYMSFERMMKCGVGICGHCEVGGKYVCKNGPVFTYDVGKTLED